MEEIARREARQRKLEEARRVIEARHKAKMDEKQREFEEKAAERAARQERGEPVRGPEPQPPPAEPEATEQYNFTDPESRIMKAVITPRLQCEKSHLRSFYVQAALSGPIRPALRLAPGSKR